MKKLVEFSESNPLRNEILVQVKLEAVEDFPRLKPILGKTIELTALRPHTSRAIDGAVLIKGIGNYPACCFLQVVMDEDVNESFEERFNRKLREDRKLDLEKRIDFITLLRKVGGDWLGCAREWIQRKTMNGEHVTWGSNDILKIRSYLTVQDIELFAAEIAASAINEHNKKILSNGVKGFEKQKHIKPSTADKLFPLYVQAINQLDDYFEYRHESEKDKAFVMRVIDSLAKQTKEIQEAKSKESGDCNDCSC